MKMQQAPYLLCTTEMALAIGRTLMLVPPEVAELTELPEAAKPEKVERTLFAYRIPYLPDLLASPHLSGGTERERLAEVLDRQVRLVSNLWKWKGIAFALRFCSQPERGEVEITFVARGVAKSGQGRYLGQQIASDVATLLGSSDYPVEPVSTETGLKAILEPVAEPFIVEIRQHEEVLSMMRGDAYVVHPFRPPLATWIPAFKVLVEQQAPCVISVYLEPTELYHFERELFAKAAQLAETLSDWTFEGLAYRGRLADPVARIVARFYTDYLQRLTAPFLLTVQVGSPDLMAARNVAQTLAAELTETHTFAEAAQGTALLPSGFDLIVPETGADLQAARRTLTALDLHPWGRSEATEGKERLRYLMDARTASAAFRFPVPIRGGIPGVRTRQPAPSYDVGPRMTTVASDALLLGQYTDRGGNASLPIAIFNKHVLVAGTTGYGKTTTAMQLLGQLWEKGIPFLVIEPAKIEYRSLLDSPIGAELQIFTLGDEAVSPFRLNPLEIQPGVRVETHIAYLRACFQAVLPTFGILPSLIEESLLNIYAQKGWNLTDRRKSGDERLMPVLGELYHEIIRVTEGRGYSEKTRQDIRAAAAGRIGSLLRGSKGRMLNTQRSIPMHVLMGRPTVLELEALSDDEKALVMLFLLTMIREYCRVTRTGSKLQHVTLIEEAHRVMAKVAHQADWEIMADTRAEAAGMFSGMLSEVRAFGEGLIIAEQIPNRLADDALKNTNIKIVHRLLGKDDREAIGATMNLGQEQELYLVKLLPGQAAIFAEGFEKPTFVKVENYRGKHGLPERIPEEKIEAHMARFREEHQEVYRPFDGCSFCRASHCYRDRVAMLAYELEAGQRFHQALRAFKRRQDWREVIQICHDAVCRLRLDNETEAAYCYFVHLFGFPVTKALCRNFVRAYNHHFDRRSGRG